MPATVSHLSAKGFKSIASVDIELRALNVLIGPNGAGKTNFIGLFAMLGELIDGRLQTWIARQGGAEAVLTNGLKHTTELALTLRFGTDEYRARLTPTADGHLFFAEESASWHRRNTPEPLRVSLGTGHLESATLTTQKKIAQIARGRMAYWRVFHFHDTSATAKVKQLGELHDDKTLRPDASNLAAFLYRLRKTHRRVYTQIVETVRQVAPFFDDFRLEPDRVTNEKIRLEWVSRGTDAYFNASALSDGTLRFMCLATLLLQPEPPSVIVVDEPELGLHPFAINVLAGLFRMASKRAQLIVSTQSVTLVNQFEPEDVIVVDRTPSGSSFRRLTEDEAASWLDEYALGDLWEKNVLGGRPQ